MSDYRPEHLDFNTPTYLDPHVSRGLFLRRHDQRQARKEDFDLIRWILVGTPLFLLVLLVGYCVTSYKNATTPDVIMIQELNWRKFENPDIPFEDAENHVYTTVNSIAEAENWLLGHGYKSRLIHTRGKYEYGGEHSSYLKMFPVKGRALSLDESVVMIEVDYGNGDIYRFPFRTLPDESAIDFSRFERSRLPAHWNGRMPEHTDAGNTVAFELGFYSTHNWANRAPLSHRLEYNWPDGGYDIEKPEEGRKETREEARRTAEEERTQFQRQVEEALN